MRQARNAAKRGAVAKPVPLPAPVKGWATADALVNMKAAQAVLLDNWFPEGDSVRPRRGSVVYASGLGNRPVEALFSFVSGSVQRMFAACGSQIYDITDPANPQVAYSGLKSARWRALRFVTSGGPQLILVNGLDAPLRFNGTAWSKLVFTFGGVTSGGTAGTAVPFDGSRFMAACGYNSRLYFISDTAMYYCPADSFQGDLGVLQVGSELANGGTLTNLARWTHDSGNGPQSWIVALSSEGEAVVYQGTNPSNAASWSLMGKYDLAPVLGSRATVSVGGDLGVLTRDGLLAMTKVVQLDRSQDDNAAALTSSLRPTIKQDGETYKDLYGWQTHIHRERGMLIVNVPIAENTGLSRQYVMNVQTGAWTRFNGLNAVVWHSFNGDLYFGAANGRVIQADVGFGDLGKPTIYPLIAAFTAISGRGMIKQASLIRPVVMSNIPITLQVGVATDYVLALPGTAPNAQDLGAARWNSARFNASRWTSSQFGAPQQAWANAQGVGMAFAPACLLTLDASTPPSADIRLIGFDLMLQPGGPL